MLLLSQFFSLQEVEMSLVLCYVLTFCNWSASLACQLQPEPDPIFVLATTWEQAEAVIGEKNCGFQFVGSVFGSTSGLTLIYPNWTVYQDPKTGLIVGRPRKK
jgi:hypothetical protein